jgi:N-methylhydantoinase B/oxoprolinase/acetone carboxylase alpha subunit
MLERITNPPEGLGGGQPGALSQMTRNGELLRPKLMVSLERGDECDLRTAGGGGFGPPPERDATLLELDVQNGIVGTAAAAGVYRL